MISVPHQHSDQRAIRYTTRSAVLWAFVDTIAVYGVLVWLYVTLFAVFSPGELSSDIAPWIPIRRDTLGMVCFGLSALAYFARAIPVQANKTMSLYQHVAARRQRRVFRALVVAPYYYPKVGGVENYARQLGIALNKTENWEIVVATSEHIGRDDHLDLVDRMRIYRLAPWFKFSNTPVNLWWPLKLRRIIRKERPDVILAHTPVPYMADAAALAAGRTPIILFYHAATLLKGDSRLFNMVARAYGLYESVTLRRATRIVAVSDYVKAQLSPRLQHKTVVVPNAVWAKEVVNRRQPARSPHFVFVGSLDRTHAWKGLDLIIKAIANYKSRAYNSPQLTIIGGGNYRQHYEQLSKDLGLSGAIKFTGVLIGSMKDNEIAQATALICYPTTANDAFPTVILEAWALGVPVIAANIGPLSTLINDGSDGYLALPHDAAALATAMQQVAETTPAERARVAEAAAERVLRNYTWEDQAAIVAQLVRTLK